MRWDNAAAIKNLNQPSATRDIVNESEGESSEEATVSLPPPMLLLTLSRNGERKSSVTEGTKYREEKE